MSTVSTYIPASYDNVQSHSISSPSNGYTGSSSTTRASIVLTKGTGSVTEVFYNFSDIDIPLGSVITSVSCTYKCSLALTGSTRVSTAEVQLFCGNTPMGVPYYVGGTTTPLTIPDCGTWTAAQLQNARIRIYGVRGTKDPNNDNCFYFYGATLTVNYSVMYNVTTSSSTSVNISPTTQDYIDGSNVTVTLDTDEGFMLTDNGVDVTEELNESNGSYLYTIQNIQEDHVVKAFEPKPYIKLNDTWVQMKYIYYKTNGVWEKVTGLKKKNNGVWKNVPETAIFNEYRNCGVREIIFNAPLDEVNMSKDLVSGVNGTVNSGTFDSTTHSVSGSAVKYQGIVKWDLDGTDFPTKVQVAYTNGNTICVSWEMYCTTNTYYAVPFTIGTWGSQTNSTRFYEGEGLTADPSPTSTSSANHISTNTWVTITYKTNLSNGYTEVMTSERPNFVYYTTYAINCTASIIRYVNIFGRIWNSGGSWTGKMRNVLVWIE